MEAYIHSAQREAEMFVIRFSGCNFQCRYCNVPHLVEFHTGELVDLRTVLLAIDNSGASQILFTGGEPLLQRQALIEIARYAHKKQLLTSLCTNASKPEVLQALLTEELIDEYLVDIKASAATFARVTRSNTFFKPAQEIFDEITTSVQLLKKHGKQVVFKTVITPGLLYRKEDLLEIAALLEPLQAVWVLEPFNPAITLDSQLQGVAPPTNKFLQQLAELIQNKYPALRLRIIEELTPPPQKKSA